MSYLAALILGIVEGFTEFLPISSTAHLILASELLGLDQSEFVKTFEIAIQSGAMLAVIALYWRRFLDAAILKKVAAAFVPTALVGYVLYGFIKDRLIGDLSVVLWALGIGGVALIAFEWAYRSRRKDQVPSADAESVGKEISSMSYARSAAVGLAQALAVIPGVSRSAATIIGGLALGMSRPAIVEFSFLLAVPTILSATAYDLLKSAPVLVQGELGLLAVGLAVSFVTAVIGIRFLLAYVSRRSFAAFGAYRIVLALLFAAFLAV